MSIDVHLAELHRNHGELERELDSALNHPYVYALEIVSLKRRKLALKDQMEKLKATQQTKH